jgi:hypothetical protein
MWVNLTCVEQVQCVVQDIPFIHLRITTKDDESVAHQQTGMADSGSWAFGSCRNRIARHFAGTSLAHPEIALDRTSIDQPTHEINRAISA